MSTKSKHGLLRKTKASLKIIDKSEGYSGQIDSHEIFRNILEIEKLNSYGLSIGSPVITTHKSDHKPVFERDYSFSLKDGSIDQINTLDNSFKQASDPVTPKNADLSP